MPVPTPNFPGIGPIGGFYVLDGTTSNNAMEVTADNMAWVGGPVLYSMLAEMRVQSQLLAIIANVPDQLSTLRADAIADMGTLYTVVETTPVASS